MGDTLEGAFVVVAESRSAVQTVRNICNAHEEAVRYRFGAAVLFEGTEFGAFLAFRLREKHGEEIRLGRTVRVGDRCGRLRRAARAAAAFETRSNESTPYHKFAVGTDHPAAAEMRARDLPDDGPRSADERDESSPRTP